MADIASRITTGIFACAALATFTFCGSSRVNTAGGSFDGGSSVDDASSLGDDAAPPADANPVDPRFCKTRSRKPAFCDDFDGPPIGAAGVAYGPDGRSGGIVEPDNTVARSAPSSERFFVGPFDAGSPKGAPAAVAQFGVDLLPIPSSRFAVATDVLVASLGAEQKLLDVQFPSSYGLTLWVSSGGATIREEWVYPGVPKTTPLPSGIGASKWARLELEWVFGAADAGVTGSFTIRIDGSTIHSVPFAAASPTEYPTVTLGTHAGVAPWTAHYDNFVIDVE